LIEQPPITHLVSFGFGMLTAIDLYNQAPLATDKIDNEVPYRLLSNEFMTVNRARP
jgi:hypothetical protein